MTGRSESEVDAVAAGEVPETLEAEQRYAIEAEYAPDGAERRRPVRRAHLENFERLVRAGVIVFGGALGDVESAFIVVRVPASMLVLPVIALRFVNPTQLVTRVGNR